MRQNHTIGNLYNENSRILILGSFPSVKSREQGFFYGHPQNRFWKVLSTVLNQPLPTSIDEKKEFILNNKIALWDVIASCEIKGSSDSSIKNVVPNNINEILNNSKVKTIFTNGKLAHNLYNKYIFEKTNIAAISLPSTSPANAAFSLDRLCDEWRIISKHLKSQ